MKNYTDSQLHVCSLLRIKKKELVQPLLQIKSLFYKKMYMQTQFTHCHRFDSKSELLPLCLCTVVICGAMFEACECTDDGGEGLPKL